MKHLKNLPETPALLSSLIDIRPGQVISMALSRNEDFQMTLFAFADGENISEESYTGDTFYYIIEGEMPVQIDGKTCLLTPGSCMPVPAGKLHAIGGQNGFKMLQITLYK